MASNRRWWAIVTIGLSIFMVNIDMMIVSIALPVMAQHFHQSAAAMSSVNLSYSIPMTILLIPVGLSIARFRPLYLFTISVLGFALASVGCGLAPNLTILLVFRVLQACCGAIIQTLGLALAAIVVKPEERGRAMGIIGSLAPLGLVTGPGLGGVLLSHWDWPIVFFVNAPVSIVIAALAWLSMQNATLTRKQENLGDSLRSLLQLLLKLRFMFALLALLFLTVIGGAMYFLMPFDLSGVQQFSPAIAGATLLSMPLGIAVMSFLGGFLTDRLGLRAVLLLAGAFLFAGLLTLALVVGQPTTPLNVDWRLLITGMGLGLLQSPNQTLLMSIGPRESAGDASALSGVGRNIGFSLGPVLISLVWVIGTSGTAVSDLSTRMVNGIAVIAGSALLGLIFLWLAVPRSSHSIQPIQEVQAQPAPVSQIPE